MRGHNTPCEALGGINKATWVHRPNTYKYSYTTNKYARPLDRIESDYRYIYIYII